MTKDGVESYRKVDDGREENAPAVVADTETDVNERSEEVGEDELLPGIPNDITVQVIGPKLSFKDLAILCLVNKKWGQTVQSGQVHDARVRSCSTETFIILHQSRFIDENKKYTIALHSPLDLQPCFFLPPMPVHGGFRYNSKCIALAGKIYILGGVPVSPVCVNEHVCCNEVYVFDPVGAGLSQWKQCASMQRERSCFAAGVLDGKIYVFGSGSYGKGVQCEVYDPEIDTWFPIPDMPFRRYYDFQVATLGGELFLYGGIFYPDDDAKGDLVAYHPGKNEWRWTQVFCNYSCNIWGCNWRNAFVAQGKFHKISQRGIIYVYDMEKNSWSFRHSVRGFNSVNSGMYKDAWEWEVEPRRYTVVGDTIWILAEREEGPNFAKIKGFGSNQREVDYYFQTVYPADDCLTIQL